MAKKNALAYSEMRETPVKNRLAQYAGNALSAVDQFARAPFGLQNPPVAMLSDALGVPAVTSTLNRLAYGDRLTQGSGQTLQIRPDVLEAAMAAAPVAAKFPRATLGAAGMLAGAADTGAGRAMFIGANAKTWDAAAAAKAAQMDARRVDPRVIWQETGTFKGADGKWRQEISDKYDFVETPDGDIKEIGANMLTGDRGKAEALSKGWSPEATARQLMAHEDLYTAYPELAPTPVTASKELGAALYKQRDGSGNRIELNVGDLARQANPVRTADLDATKSPLLHELQHAIQDKEGFASGGEMRGIENVLRGLSDKKYSESRALRNLGSRNDPLDAFAEVKPGAIDKAYLSEADGRKLRELADRVRNYGDPVAYEAYRRLAGEAEARATQARMNLSMPERRAKFPYDSYDVAISDLIVR